MRKTFLFGLVAAFAAVSPASGQVVINEVIGSTTGADTEFIELFNIGTSLIDLTGWVIDEVESDPGASLGDVDATFGINAGSTIAPGDFFLIGNPTFETAFGITSNQTENLTIENSSYTLVLRDALGAAVFTAFVSDSDGVVPPGFTPDISVGPDGTFLPAGFALDVDGDPTDGVSILEFAPTPAASATPTPGANVPISSIPEPSSMALLGLVGLAGIVRRRK